MLERVVRYLVDIPLIAVTLSISACLADWFRRGIQVTFGFFRKICSFSVAKGEQMSGQ
jgi:hypothetical protein